MKSDRNWVYFITRIIVTIYFTLYHRLSVIEIRVPPLRDRREDIPELVLYFSQKAARENSTPTKKFTPAALEKLKSLPWSGNIRQLQNIVERLCILCSGEEIDEEQIELYC